MIDASIRWKIEDFRFNRVIASGEGASLLKAKEAVHDALKRGGVSDLRGKSAVIVQTGKLGTTRIWNGRAGSRAYAPLRWEEQEVDR